MNYIFFILFSVLAVAIFSFRKTNLLKVQSYNAAEVIIHSHILVIYIPTITDTLEKFEHKKLVNLFTNRIKTASLNLTEKSETTKVSLKICKLLRFHPVHSKVWLSHIWGFAVTYVWLQWRFEKWTTLTKGGCCTKFIASNYLWNNALVEYKGNWTRSSSLVTYTEIVILFFIKLRQSFESH